MNQTRFSEIAAQFQRLRIALVGDFCLDRYLEIDPRHTETSIETGLPVHNVTRVRAQPGAAGTVLSNLVALGVGKIDLVGFCGDDGEGYELRRELKKLRGVSLEHFFTTSQRRTFTYCKPLIIKSGQPPRELNRLDSKNGSPTPKSVESKLVLSLQTLGKQVDAIVVMDQVDVADTGVVTARLLDELKKIPREIPVIADSRRGLGGFPPTIFKMNAVELAALTGNTEFDDIQRVESAAIEIARRNQEPVVVTMAEQGLIGATTDGQTFHVPALPTNDEIDIVGAGDSVTSAVTAALACGASIHEALQIASIASSIVIHQLGTTGSASVGQISAALKNDPPG